jgi:excisionase family DNA binding protein
MAAFLTASQLAARWSCSPSYVRQLAREGAIPAMRLGSDWRFSLTAIEEYEAGHTTEPRKGDEPRRNPTKGGTASSVRLRAKRAWELNEIHQATCRAYRQALVCSTCHELNERAERLIAAWRREVAS